MKTLVKYLMLFVVVCVLYSCASIGRPAGGPQDMLAPVYIKSKPAPGELNYNGNKVEIEFDELVQLKDQNDKVVVSPAQKQPAVIRSNGKKVTVEFKDTLLPNTTYSIDFSDAIQDFTEGNPIDGYSFAFSTGEDIDSLQISGILLNARDLEPLKGIVVGVHSNLHDTAFASVPLERIARTNDKGQFTIRNLKAGKYHLFAINDIDRDYKFAPTEDIAFYDSIVEPYAESVSAIDTLYTATHEIDTIKAAMHTHFYPNDILLCMFNEERASQYLVKNERPDSMKLYVEFATKADTLPRFELLDITPESEDWYRVNYSPTNDTITYWLTDKRLISMDTIRVKATYMRTDTANVLSMGSDTLLFKKKIPRPIKKKKKKEEEEDTVPEIKFTPFSVTSKATQDIHLPLTLLAEVPIESVAEGCVKLQMKEDTLWTELSTPKLVRESENNLHEYRIYYEWVPGAEYKLSIDSAAIVDIQGCFNAPIEHPFKVRPLEDYCDLYFTIDTKEPAFVELLQSGDKPVRVAPVVGGEAQFNYLNPGTYYARLVIDRNNNGKYDTGNYAEKRQPEDVYYFHKKMTVKKNWEIAETWELNALPVDKQKHDDIKKNKPSLKKWEQKKEDNKSGTDEYDEYGQENDNPFGANQFNQTNRNPFLNR